MVWFSRGRGLVAEAPAEAAKQKETPTEVRGLPVSAGHLALNASTSGNTTGVRFGRASVQQYLFICGTETKAQGCVENIIAVKISATGLGDECAADAGVEGIIDLDQNRLR